MPVVRVFGLETEYGFTHLPCNGAEGSRADVLGHIERISHQIAPCVPSADGRGIFLASGGRFYLDWMNASAKPEFATAECADPMALLNQVMVGDAFVDEIARRVEREIGGDMIFSKTNVDYASGNTWGCHESYLIRRGFEE